MVLHQTTVCAARHQLFHILNSSHRPGLIRFMTKLSKLYEMHVYTMGTRSYANAVCAALDPSGIWFGSRILTRNESGS